MKERLTIGTASAAPGEAARGVITVAHLNDGSPVEVPVCVLNGVDDGPVVWVQNAVHGDEYVGLGAMQRFLQQADPSQLKGAIVAIPVLNILAYRAGQRGAPQDGMDMNRVYPGKPLTSAMHLFAHSEIVIDRVFSLIKQHADIIIDLHDGGWMGIMSPYIQYFATAPEVDKAARAIAMASGMDIVWESPAGFVSEKAPGSIGTAASPLGIPTLTMEIGGEGRLQEQHVSRMYAGLTNILKHLEVLPGERVQHGLDTPLLTTKGNWLRPECGGVYYPKVAAGQLVEAGTLCAEVCNVFGDVIEELRAPVDGVVIGIRTYGTIQTGQYALNVAVTVPTFD